jgi:GNAT superfamily N-acetyltransferase
LRGLEGVVVTGVRPVTDPSEGAILALVEGRGRDSVIRPLEREQDAPAVVDILREANPHWLLSVASWRYWREHLPARAELSEWVAVEGGQIVGVSSALRRFFTKKAETAFVNATVRRDHRCRGIGASLYTHAEGHARTLGCRRLATYFPWTREGLSFAEARGFRRERTAVQSSVDPRTVDLSRLARLPPGIRVLPLSELGDRLEAVFAVEAEAILDEPASEPADDIRFEEWLDELDNPLFSRPGSFCALDGDDIVAIASLYVDLETRQARNGGTGTLRTHRGRGLATLAKLALLRWAAAIGIEAIWTTNDETNAAMLAINRKLGYRPAARDIEAIRELA